MGRPRRRRARSRRSREPDRRQCADPHRPEACRRGARGRQWSARSSLRPMRRAGRHGAEHRPGSCLRQARCRVAGAEVDASVARYTGADADRTRHPYSSTAPGRRPRAAIASTPSTLPPATSSRASPRFASRRRTRHRRRLSCLAGWARRSAFERAAAMERVASAIGARRDELARSADARPGQAAHGRGVR